MAKRRFTMTTVEVLERWDNFGKDLKMGSSDKMSDDDQLKFPEEFDELDDPDESIMEGSDDKFSDLGEVEEDEHDGAYFVHPRTSSPGSSEVYTSPLSTPSPSTTPTSPSSTSRLVTTHQNTDNSTSWSSSLSPVTIKPFTSSVGPTVPSSASPVDVFQLFFSQT